MLEFLNNYEIFFLILDKLEKPKTTKTGNIKASILIFY